MGVNVKNSRNSLVVLTRKDKEANKVVSLRLLPGDNDVDPKDWDFVKQHPGVKELLDSETGCLEVKSGKAKPHPTKASGTEKAAAHGRRAEELKDFSPKQVKDILADTDDEALLEAWSEDDRKPIRALVRKRLREVKKGAK